MLDAGLQCLKLNYVECCSLLPADLAAFIRDTEMHSDEEGIYPVWLWSVGPGATVELRCGSCFLAPETCAVPQSGSSAERLAKLSNMALYEFRTELTIAIFP